MPTLDSLPIEILRRILYHTNLVAPYRKVPLSQGLRIENGHVQWPICKALFLVDHKVSMIAREMAFSMNRISLRGKIDSMCTWIESQPEEFLHLVRDLDIILSFARNWDHPYEAWKKLVTLLHKFKLENLTLSIDGAHDYNVITEDAEDFEWLKSAYKPYISALQTGQLHSLKAFFVFWPKWASLETEAEEAVLGKGYNASSHGKIPYKDRDWRLPHGWEWDEEDEFGDYTTDFLDYVPSHMEDEE